MRRPRVHAGLLRQRYRLERLGGISSGYTSGAEAWETVAEFRGQLKTSSGSRSKGEQEVGGALREITDVEIVTHYNGITSSIKTDDRLVDLSTNAILNIKQVDDPDGLRRMIHITAERGRPNG